MTIMVVSIFVGGIHLTTAQSSDVRDGKFTTNKGTSVSLNASLDQESSSSGTPQLMVDVPYTLSIQVTLEKLANSTKDIHDLTFAIAITQSGFFGTNSKTIYSAYYFDSTTRMTQDGQVKIYNFTIYLTGELQESNADMAIKFSMKENVPNLPDPTTDFDGIGYTIGIIANDGTHPITFAGNTSILKDQSVLTDKGSKVYMSANLTHEGLLTDGKPSLKSNLYYSLIVNVTLLELGPDPLDIHDLEVDVHLKDSAITDYIPGNSAVSYFSTYGFEPDAMSVGQSKIFNFSLTPQTNINNTQVSLNVNFKFRERIDAGLISTDPTSEYSIKIETHLNDHLTNSLLGSDEGATPISFLPILVMLVIIPLIRKRKFLNY